MAKVSAADKMKYKIKHMLMGGIPTDILVYNTSNGSFVIREGEQDVEIKIVIKKEQINMGGKAPAQTGYGVSHFTKLAPDEEEEKK